MKGCKKTEVDLDDRCSQYYKSAVKICRVLLTRGHQYIVNDDQDFTIASDFK